MHLLSLKERVMQKGLDQLIKQEDDDLLLVRSLSAFASNIELSPENKKNHGDNNLHGIIDYGWMMHPVK